MCSCSPISSDNNKPYFWQTPKSWRNVKKKKRNGESKLQLAKTGIGWKDHTKETFYITALLRVTNMHTLTENVKIKGSTAHTQYTWKQNKKLQPHAIRKILEINQEECNQPTRVNAKKIWRQKCQAQKENMITQHQPLEEKRKKQTCFS